MEDIDHTHFPEPPKEPPEFFAPDCADQLPVFSGVGRGLRGDSFKVIVAEDDQAETYLEGLSYDAATKTWVSQWMSENVNGGQLMHQYNLRPYTLPQTFTITFRYKRPNRSKSEWTWTTPAIPYIWDADNDGLADIDEIVGTGVAALFLKKTTEANWNYPTVHSSEYPDGMDSSKHDKTLYPDDWDRSHFNAPNPGDPWSVNLQYGINGDIDAPNVDDLAKILGITVVQIRNIIADGEDVIGNPEHNITGDNLKDYIDNILEHIHDDMGFDNHLVGDDDDVDRDTIKKYIDGLRADLYKNLGVSDPSSNYYSDNPNLDLTHTQKYGPNAGTTTHHTTVKAYVDARCDDLQEGLDAMGAKYDNAIGDIVAKFYGGGTMNADGHITWPNGNKAAVGNINVLSNTTANAILTHDGNALGDLKGE